MKVAVPTKDDKLCTDLDYCDEFTIITVDNNIIENEKRVKIPLLNSKKYGDWLVDSKIDLLITGTIDQDLKDSLNNHHITSITGAPKAYPRILVEFYTLNNNPLA